MEMLISGLADMRQHYGQVTALLSMVDPDDAEHIPEMGVPRQRRLLLVCNDVDSFADARERRRARPGSQCTPPSVALVRKALAFARGLTPSDKLLVHCHYGISRSTALAFAILCQAEPEVSERELFQRLLNLRPQACPNALIVQYADKLLNRNGRLSQAALGRIGSN